MKKIKIKIKTIPFPFLKRLSKKGFTLVEMLIAMGIISVLMTGIAFIFAPALDVIRNVRHNVFSDTVSIEIGDYIEERLIRSNTVHIINANATDAVGSALDSALGSPATEMSVMIDGTPPGYLHHAMIIERATGRIYDLHNIASTTTAGDICDDDNAIFLEPFYNNSTYEIEIAIDSGEKTFMQLTTTPYRDGDVLSSTKTKSFFLLNNKIELTNNYNPATVSDYILIYYKYHDFS